MPIHLTKVAYSCASLETLARRTAKRAVGGEVRVVTRMRPRRAEELAGGALHWIVRHRIVARQQILRLEDRSDGRIDIVLSDRLVPLSPVPRRGHQGWRYLEDDLPEQTDGSGLGDLPPRLHAKLSELLLV